MKVKHDSYAISMKTWIHPTAGISPAEELVPTKLPAGPDHRCFGSLISGCPSTHVRHPVRVQRHKLTGQRHRSGHSPARVGSRGRFCASRFDSSNMIESLKELPALINHKALRLGTVTVSGPRSSSSITLGECNGRRVAKTFFPTCPSSEILRQEAS